MAKKLSLAELQQFVQGYVDDEKVANPSFTPTTDDVFNLVGKISRTFDLDGSYEDKLPELDGDNLPFGETIEEYFKDLEMPIDHDATGSSTLAPHRGTSRPAFYSYRLPVKDIPITIDYNEVEKAVLTQEGYANITAKLTKRLYDSKAMYKYAIKKDLLALYGGKAIEAMSASARYAVSTAYGVGTYLTDGSGSYAVVEKAIAADNALSWDEALAQGYLIKLSMTDNVAAPTDEATGEDFIVRMKQLGEDAGFVSEGNSLNGNTVGTNEGGLLFIVKKHVMPTIDVKTIAGAFQQDALSIPFAMKKVDDFGNDENGIWGMLIDSRGCKVHTNYESVRPQENAQGDFMNLWLHYQATCFYSPNTFLHVFYSK